MRRVAALCVRADSIYKRLRGVEPFDATRDARTFAGGVPVIAHPPCAQWSRMKAFAADKPEEKALGPLCVEFVRRCGGVLEHPADSSLWKHCGLPRPGAPADEFGGYTVELSQFWLGHLAEKRTWLYIVGVPRHRLPPIQLPIGEPEYAIASSRRHQANRSGKKSLHKSLREHTPEPMARWLLTVARSVTL